MLLGPIVGADPEEWDRMTAVNVEGLLYTTRAALPHLLRAAEEGARRVADIVNISSIAGRVAWNGSGVYSFTKFGVNGFTESLRQEITRRHVPGAQALTANELRDLLAKLRASEKCQRHDLVEPITLFIATGLRISELLGLQWADFDESAATLTITGKVIRAAGKGLMRIDETKTAAGRRTLPLPSFAAIVLAARRGLPYLGQQPMIFPSTAGTYRDPDNFRARWIEVRSDLGVPSLTTHSFRKTVATLIDDEGLSARIGADHLGHSRISMTQDKYMARGRVHTAVADLLDRTVGEADGHHGV
jgi:integrase